MSDTDKPTEETVYEVRKMARPRKGWAVIATTGAERRIVGSIYSTKAAAVDYLAGFDYCQGERF
jgi:hypothetical protein